MKQQIVAIGIMGCWVLVTGCVYLENRTRDFSDIVTLAVEDRNISCSARFIYPWGLSLAKGEGYGLREGWIGRYEYTEKTIMLFPHGGIYEVEFTPERDYRDKSYSVFWLDRENSDFLKQCLNLQVMVGVIYGVRAGLNLGEVVDFMVGWTTLDILKDDKSVFSKSTNETNQLSSTAWANSIIASPKSE